MKILLHSFVFLAASVALAQNQIPQISNVYLSFSGSTATIHYTLSDAENDACEIHFLISDDNGKNFVSKAGTVSGHVGFPVFPGSDKKIFWDTDTISDLSHYQFKIVADDRQVPSVQSIVGAVDSNLLKRDLQFINGIRHYKTNPAKLEEVKDSIENRFRKYGLETYRHEFVRDNYIGHNIIGKKPGLASEDTTLIIDAHFDTVNNSPGADDNGSGVAGVWEALRVLAPFHFKKTIKFIGFDFEEVVNNVGTWGSYLYTQSQIPAWEKIIGVANFEMIGYYSELPFSQQVPAGFNLLFPNQFNQVAQDSFRGNFITIAGDASSDKLVKTFDSLTRQYVPDLKIISVTLPGNGTIAPDFRRSDHQHFWDLDIPALMITDGANFRNQHYHLPSDDVSKIHFTFMSKVVKATVATIATLAGLQHSSVYRSSVLAAGIPPSNVMCPILLTPNPARGQINIQADHCFSGNLSFRLFTANGKKIRELQPQSSAFQLDISNLLPGTYFGVIDDGKNRVVRKIVVSK
jgi:Zn-dependent M28 family amino/carboxypeptidase